MTSWRGAENAALSYGMTTTRTSANLTYTQILRNPVQHSTRLHTLVLTRQHTCKPHLRGRSRSGKGLLRKASNGGY